VRAALLAAAPGVAVDVAFRPTCPERVVATVYFCCLDLADRATAIDVREDGETVVFEVASTASDDLVVVRDRVETFGGTLTVGEGAITGVLPIAERPQASAR
jgi:hypothetical protein